MAKRTSSSTGRTKSRKAKTPGRKVGSSRPAAKSVGGKKDFGVPEDRALGDYARRVSRESKFQPAGSHRADPRQERGSTQSARISGVGKSNAGRGGASGGDLDTDIVGAGTGKGLAQGGPDRDVSPAEWSSGGSEEFASGPPAKGRNQKGRRRIGPERRMTGSTVHRGGGDKSSRDYGGIAESTGRAGRPSKTPARRKTRRA